MSKIKKIIASVVAVAAIVGGGWWTVTTQAAQCSDFNVVSCGTPNIYSVREVYGRANVKGVYNHVGITDNMIYNTTPKTGTVYRDGRIVVDGRVVGTAARTFQTKVGTLQYTPEGMVKYGGTMYYQYAVANSFVNRYGTVLNEQEEIFAWFDNSGKFIAGVIKSCGNPVWTYSPTPPPTPPKNPSLTCDALNVRTVARNTFQFKVTATTKDGASIKNYTYDLGNGRKKTTSSASLDYTYAKAGTYKVSVTVNGNAGGVVSKTSSNCQATVVVKPKEQPKTPAIDIDKKVDSVEYKLVGVNTEFTYQIRVKNTGNVNLKKAVVTDKQPAGVTFIKASRGEIKNGVWTYTIPELKVGQSMDFTIRAKVPTYKAGKIKNTACVNTPEVNPNKPNENDDCDDADIEVVNPGKITVCEIKTKRIIQISKNEFNSGFHADKDSELCKEIPTTPYTPPTPPTTPEVPTYLPHTGANDILVGGIGLAATISTDLAYIASRRYL